jgi:hypothetical protein
LKSTCFLLFSSLGFPPEVYAQQVPEASSCLRSEVGKRIGGISTGEGSWAINLENVCTYPVQYIGCYSSPTRDQLGQTVTCSAADRSSHIGLLTWGSKPGVFVGGGTINPGPQQKGSLGGWNHGNRPSVTVSLAACPKESNGKQVRFFEARFTDGAITAKCEIGDYKELRIIGM